MAAIQRSGEGVVVVAMDGIVHGILQARILQWVVIPFFRDQTQVSHIAGGFCTS